MGNNDIRQFRCTLNRSDRSHHFNMHFLAELYIGFKCFPDTPHQGFRLDIILVFGLLLFFDIDHKEILIGQIFFNDASLLTLDKNLDGSVREP